MSERPYRVDLAPAVTRELRRLPIRDAAALRDPILALGLEPRPPGATKLAGTDLWRIRVGPLRAIYAIDDETRAVVVVRVGRRSETTYRRLRDEPGPYDTGYAGALHDVYRDTAAVLDEERSGWGRLDDPHSAGSPRVAPSDSPGAT